MRTHKWIVIDKTNMTKIHHSKNLEDILPLFFKKSGETRKMEDFIVIKDEEEVLFFHGFDYDLPYVQAVGRLREFFKSF